MGWLQRMALVSPAPSCPGTWAHWVKVEGLNESVLPGLKGSPTDILKSDNLSAEMKEDDKVKVVLNCFSLTPFCYYNRIIGSCLFL